MKKILSLLLALLLIFSTATTLIACNDDYYYDDSNNGDSNGDNTGDNTGGGNNNNNTNTGNNTGNNTGSSGTTSTPTIVVPEYKDYGRGTINFDEIVYSRPNIEEIIEKLNGVSDTIKKNEIPYSEQIDAILAIEDDYVEVVTAYSYLEIKTSIDIADTAMQDEYSYVTTSYPSFAQAIEGLFVACAQSPRKADFEADYFGYSLDEYVDGGDYTDEVVALMARETEIENEYSSLTPEQITITFGGKTETAQYFIDYYSELYKGKTSTLTRYLNMIYSAYYDGVSEWAKPKLVELIKIRKELAEALEVSDYAEYAYDSYGRDYSAKDTEKMLDDIANYIVPLYIALMPEFKETTTPNSAKNINRVTVINNVYTVLENNDEQLFDIYCYMLQYGLYNIEKASTKRTDGAFTTYLEKYAAPFIYVSANGDITDYTTVLHEFGHFADNYINNGSSSSLDIAEIYSQGLELLMLTRSEGTLSADLCDFLEIYQIQSILETIITQAFFSAFEHGIYELADEDVTVEKLGEVAYEAAIKFKLPEIFGLRLNNEEALGIAIITHTMLYPYYVQSYFTSALVAVDIYYTELAERDAGFAAYKTLIARDGNNDLGFIAELERAGLDSPFTENYLKDLSNEISKHVYGVELFPEQSGEESGDQAA